MVYHCGAERVCRKPRVVCAAYLSSYLYLKGAVLTCNCVSSQVFAVRRRYELVSHEEPRVEAFIDKEVQQSSVYVSFKHPTPSLQSPVRTQATMT